VELEIIGLIFSETVHPGILETRMTAPFSILLADDHVMFRRGVRRIIQSIGDVEVVGEASDGLELLQLLKKTTPNLIILDISMPNLRGLEATREIKIINPEVKVLILTMHKDKEYLYHAFSAGADGYLLKEDADSELIAAIDTLRKGGTYVSPLLSSQLADLFMQKSRRASHHPGAGDHQAHRRRQIQQRSGGPAFHQQPHRPAPPGQHHAEAEYKEDCGPGEVRHSERLYRPDFLNRRPPPRPVFSGVIQPRSISGQGGNGAGTQVGFREKGKRQGAGDWRPKA
jgi:DNA-binding NarL/FixJ family response regulator